MKTKPKRPARKAGTRSPRRAPPARGSKPKATSRERRPRAGESEPVKPKRPPAPAPVLTATERKRMRGLAHALQPIVQVGHAGVTGEVLAATKLALADHELIKVRLREPEDKAAMAKALAEGTASALCGLVGHTVILFRPHPEHPRFS